MKKKAKPWLKRLTAIAAAVLMTVSMFPTLTFADDPLPAAEDEYQVQVELSKPANEVTVGEAVTITATVTRNGEEITDLEAAGLDLWFWPDVWTPGYTEDEGYSAENCTVTYSGTDGKSFSADITFSEEGKYYVQAQLQSGTTELCRTPTDFTVSAAPEPVEEPAVPVDLDNGDFESGADGWTLVPDTLKTETDSYMTNNQTSFLNLWASDAESTELAVSYEISDLPAGTYRAKISVEGGEGFDSCLTLDVTDASGNSLTGAPVSLPTTAYNQWETFQTGLFTLAEPATVIVKISGTTPAGFWGALDNLVVLGPEQDEEEDTAVPGKIEVEKVKNLSEDFIMGADISTIVSEYNSGVIYKDFDGNELENVTEFCQFLADCGINSVRVRVWNNPYDEDGNGYGAGNCDVNTATEIARACAAANIGMLIDFHYSDFWADPGRQLVPKAWAGYTVEQKADAIYNFTLDSLTQIASTGVKIDMVQVGNETNNAICGESSQANMCTLFSAGSRAVRQFSENVYSDSHAVKVVIHVANPERGSMTSWASTLQRNNVDYDVMGSSYYMFWHGSLSNLKSQMRIVQDTYGKEVMVTETSYIYTSEDTDGKTNGVSTGVDGYEVSPQGQATSVRDIIDAVNSAGGLGVYYWEPAWITVGDITGLEGEELEAQIAANNEIWETYGSGWASSHAIGYDVNVNENNYGGSEWDNQALFDAQGNALDSLHVWEYVKTGSTITDLYVSSVASPSMEIEQSETFTLPETVNVTYNRPSIGTIAEPVTWNEADVAAVDTDQPGIYTVHGTITLSQECTDGAAEAEAVCTITVLEPNLITDKDAAGFETADNFTVSGSGVRVASTEDVLEGNATLHWYLADGEETSVTYDVPIALSAGYYTFEAVAMGNASDTVAVSVLDTEGNVLFAGDPVALNNYSTEPENYLHPSVTFHLEEDTDIKLCVTINISDGGWGSADGLYLHNHDSSKASYISNGEGSNTHNLLCGDCGEVLETDLACEYELTDMVEAGTEPGYKEYTCKFCGYSYTEEIPATDTPDQPDNPDNPDDNNTPTTPGGTDDPDTPGSSGQQDPSGTTTGQNNTSTTAKGANTADNAPLMVYSLAAIGALAIITISVKRRKHS